MTATTPIPAPRTANLPPQSEPSQPTAPAPANIDEADLMLVLRWFEDILTTLASWEDADDNFALPGPLAGQQALHALRRTQDRLTTARELHASDVALLRHGANILAAGAANDDEDLCAALEIHQRDGYSMPTLAERLERLDHSHRYMPSGPSAPDAGLIDHQTTETAA